MFTFCMGHIKWPSSIQPGSCQPLGDGCYLRGRIASVFHPQKSPFQAFLKGREQVQDFSQFPMPGLCPWKALKPMGSLTNSFMENRVRLGLSLLLMLLFCFAIFPSTQATLPLCKLEISWVSHVQSHQKRSRENLSVASHSSVTTKRGGTGILFSSPSPHSSIPLIATFPVRREKPFLLMSHNCIGLC